MHSIVHFKQLLRITLAIAVLFSAGLHVNSGLKAQDLPYNFDFSSDPFANGWSQFSVSGAQVWTYNATFFNASFSAFAGGCQENEDWLITPAFDLSMSSDEQLTFDVQRGFAGDNGLEVYYSADYSGTGDPNMATWTLLDEVSSAYFTTNGIPNNTSATFGPYSDLEDVDETAVYVAFRFNYDSGDCSTWRVADFSLYSGVAPAFVPSVGSISGFFYVEGNGPSESQMYTFDVTNFEGSGDIMVGTSAGFEISLDDMDFGNSLAFPYTDGMLEDGPATVYVRMDAGLGGGSYSGTINHIGGDAAAAIVVNGVVSAAPPADSYFIDFEGPDETKGGYASGDVVLSGLLWNMTEALIGTLDADFKNGLRSARLRGYGASDMSMVQDKTNGLGTLSFVYARYGSDQQVPYKVEYSTNGGGSWTQLGDQFTGTAQQQTFTATVDVPGNVRIKISTVASTGNDNRRLNIDDIILSDFEGEGPASISASMAVIDGLDYVEDFGPSVAQSYTVSAENLFPEEGTVDVNAPANFEISADGSTWTNTLNVAYTESGASLNGTEIFVRLAADLMPGTYSGGVSHVGGGASATVEVAGEVDFAVSTLSAKKSGLEVFPNPTSDVLNIGFGNDLGAAQQVQLFDMSGKLLHSLNIAEGQSRMSLDMSNFNKGVYLLNAAYSDGSIAVVRVVKL